MAASGKRNFTDRFLETKSTRGRSHHDPNLPDDVCKRYGGFMINKLSVETVDRQPRSRPNKTIEP
jgi:hypothetical protein